MLVPRVTARLSRPAPAARPPRARSAPAAAGARRRAARTARSPRRTRAPARAAPGQAQERQADRPARRVGRALDEALVGERGEEPRRRRDRQAAVARELG